MNLMQSLIPQQSSLCKKLLLRFRRWKSMLKLILKYFKLLLSYLREEDEYEHNYSKYTKEYKKYNNF